MSGQDGPKKLGRGDILILIVSGILITTIDVYLDIAAIMNNQMFTGGSDDCGVNDIVSFLRDADGPTWDYFTQEMKSFRREADQTTLGNLNRFSDFEDFLRGRAGSYAIQPDAIIEKKFYYFGFPSGGPGYYLWKLRPLLLDNGPVSLNLTESMIGLRDTNTKITLENIEDLLGKYLKTHVGFGIAMSITLAFSFILTAVQWYEIERDWMRLWTLPLLVLQLYPQFKALQLLHKGWWGWKERDEEGEEEWKKIKKELETFESKVSHIEPFAEAWPNVLILWMYLGLTGQWFCNLLIGVKFWFSVCSAAMGIVTYLHKGPCRFTNFVGAAIVWPAACGSAAAKICLFYLSFNHLYQGDRILPTIMVFTLCYILPFVHACLVLYRALGIEEGMSTILKHPALVLLPTITCVTFGPVSERLQSGPSRGRGSSYKKDEKKIQFSWRLTRNNLIITICGIAIAYVGVGLITGFDFFFIYDLFWVAVWLAQSIFVLTMTYFLRCRCFEDCCNWFEIKKDTEGKDTLYQQNSPNTEEYEMIVNVTK